MFKNYVSSILSNRPFNPLFNADGGSGGGEGGQGGTGGGEGGQGGEGGSGEGNNDDEIKFDDKQQAHIQKIIDATIAKERKKSEKAAADAVAEAERKAKLTAEEKAKEEREKKEKIAAERETKANTRIINLEIKDVARELGVTSQKLDRFLKVVDRDDLSVDDNGDVDRKAVEAAVKAVLVDMPEFKGSTSPKGPGAEFGGGGNNDAKYSLEQIKAMTPADISKDYDEVMKSMKIHNKK